MFEDFEPSSMETKPLPLQVKFLCTHYDDVWLNMFFDRKQLQGNKFLMIKPSQVRNRFAAVQLRTVIISTTMYSAVVDIKVITEKLQ